MIGKNLRKNRFVASAIVLQKRYSKDGGNFLAAIISHYAFLSLFPLILVIVSIIGFFLARDPAVQLKLTLRVAEFFPGLAEAAESNIRALVKGRASVGLVGLAALIWTGVAGVEAAEFALGRVFRAERQGSFIKKKTHALLRLIGLGTVAIASIGLATTVGTIQASGLLGFVLKLIAVLLTLLLDFGMFIVAYRVLIPGKGPTYRDLWPGAVLVAGGWTALKLFGSWYARRTVENASAAFGTFATVVGVLALLYLVSRLFVYGAEVNALRLLPEPGLALPADGEEEHAVQAGEVQVAPGSKKDTELPHAKKSGRIKKVPGQV